MLVAAVIVASLARDGDSADSPASPSRPTPPPAPPAAVQATTPAARAERCPGASETVPRIVEAAACGNSTLMGTLLGEGSRLDATDPRGGYAGYSALHHAVGRGDLAAIQSLLGAGAHADAPDGQGNSPLHLLALGDRIVADDEIARELVHAGANVTRRNAAGRTPLDELKARPRLATASDRLLRYLAETELQLSMVSGARGYLGREAPGNGQFTELEIGGGETTGVFPVKPGADAQTPAR